MIAEIQNAIKNIIIVSTDLPSKIIYTEEQEVESYNTPPWISIMPEPSSLTPAWYKDNYYREDNSSIVVIRKYDVVQPIKIHTEFIDKQELSDVVDKIFMALPKQIALKGGIVDIEPQQVEFFLTKGALEPHGAIIDLNILYAIRENKEIQDKIKSIKFDLQNKEEE